MATPSSLNPHEKPSAPLNVQLGITSDTMLTVGWEAPKHDGGDVITKYRIEWDIAIGFTTASIPPHKGYIDIEASAHKSYTIELLSTDIAYFTRVFAINMAGAGIPQESNPISLRPARQVPGKPHSLMASPGVYSGEIYVTWQYPRIPNHGIPCSGTALIAGQCPTAYDGSVPASNGGEKITEYEVEINERPDFGGIDGSRKLSTITSCTIENMSKGRSYYIRVLARNAIGSGRYCDKSGSAFCNGIAVNAVAPL